MESDTEALMMENSVSSQSDVDDCIITLDPIQNDWDIGNTQTSTIPTSDSQIDLHEVIESLARTKEHRKPIVGLELPDGKEAHLFVSYSTEDRHLVLPIVAELERFNLACYIHERDFVAGKQIQENIRLGMQQSMKILLFLSENYVQSSFCKYESDLAFIMSMDKDENLIIPVKLDNCQTPDSLRLLTYIEPGSRSLVERILESYLSSDAEMLPVDFSSTPKRLENGYTITMPRQKSGICYICRPIVSEILLDDSTKTKLKDGKFNVTEEAVQEAIDIVNRYQTKGWLSRNSNCLLLEYACCSCTCVFLLFVALWGVLGYTVYSRQHSQRTASTQASYESTLWSVPLCFGLIVLIFVCILRNRGLKKELHQLLWEVHQKVTLNTCKDGVIFVVRQTDGCVEEVQLDVVRYDLQPCKKFLARKLKEKAENIDNSLTMTTEECEQQAEQLLRENLHWLPYHPMPDAPEIRHPVKGGKSCYCQILHSNVDG